MNFKGRHDFHVVFESKKDFKGKHNFHIDFESELKILIFISAPECIYVVGPALSVTNVNKDTQIKRTFDLAVILKEKFILLN